MRSYSNVLLVFMCIRYTQVATPLPVTFVLLLDQKKCKAPETACDNNTLCYLQKEKCDGVYDCMDWSDEEGCSEYYFRKPNSCLSSLSTASAFSRLLY